MDKISINLQTYNFDFKNCLKDNSNTKSNVKFTYIEANFSFIGVNICCVDSNK